MLQARDKKKKTHHLTNCRLRIEPSLGRFIPFAHLFPTEREREREKHQDVRKWASHASVFAYEIMRERQHLVSQTAARRRRRRNRLAAAATSCMMMVMMMVQELQSLMDRVWRIIFTMDCVKIPPRPPRRHLLLLRMEIVCMRRSSG